ncbi:hypothetical protein GCM10007907_12170 [Chitinimonas prasina]|uniref:Uncharacterized protein n=1 Tax=Chitinimonas prasina TaxID=1434937 RepID=A0ABQ5YDA9_9NEIS|nr:hypothetical protein GCM10007907_12170 [Chitinimonas prasina]
MHDSARVKADAIMDSPKRYFLRQARQIRPSEVKESMVWAHDKATETAVKGRGRLVFLLHRNLQVKHLEIRCTSDGIA